MSKTSVSTTHLNGDWTISGIVQQLPRLTKLKFNTDRANAIIAVDCSGIEEIDLHGFELLYVWLHCIKLRGLRTELVNIPDWMREAQVRMGVNQAFESEMYGGGSEGTEV
jgi:ABC-type transporter Mla MlaB component